jgi:hypothetical protein
LHCEAEQFYGFVVPTSDKWVNIRALQTGVSIMSKSDLDQSRKRWLTFGMGALLLILVLVGGLPLANAYLASRAGTTAYLPVAQKEPTYTPTPTATPEPYYYFDAFEDPNSGWPEINNSDPDDKYHFYYGDGDYRLDIFKDRRTHTASPWVALPEEDYVIEFDGRFRIATGWLHAYGIFFDGDSAPDSDQDYIALGFLWQGPANHSWGVIQYRNGEEYRRTDWKYLSNAYYHYGTDGTKWNHWKLIRTAEAIRVFCNGTYVGQVDYARPTGDDYFGAYGSTFELDQFYVDWDNYEVYPVAGSPSSLVEPSPVPPVADPSTLDVDGLVPGD